MLTYPLHYINCFRIDFELIDAGMHRDILLQILDFMT